MDKFFIETMQKAVKSKVVGKESIIIFKDYLVECQKRIEKNTEMIQRLKGQNDQFKLTSTMLNDIILKYVRLQETVDKQNEKLTDEKKEVTGEVEHNPPQKPKFSEAESRQIRRSRVVNGIEEIGK